MRSGRRHSTGSVEPCVVPFSASLFYWWEKNGVMFGAFWMNTLCRCRPRIKINIRENQFCQGFFLFSPYPAKRHVLSVNCTPPTLGTQSRPMQVINFDVFPCEWNLPWAHSRHTVYANNCGQGKSEIVLIRCSFLLVVFYIIIVERVPWPGRLTTGLTCAWWYKSKQLCGLETEHSARWPG